MKKICIILIVVILTFKLITYAENVNEIKIQINDKTINIESFIYNDKVYVPVRTITEELNYKVEWDETQNAVKILTHDIHTTNGSEWIYLSSTIKEQLINDCKQYIISKNIDYNYNYSNEEYITKINIESQNNKQLSIIHLFLNIL